MAEDGTSKMLDRVFVSLQADTYLTRCPVVYALIASNTFLVPAIDRPLELIYTGASGRVQETRASVWTPSSRLQSNEGLECDMNALMRRY